jgi:hypothetical protein
VYLRSEEHGLQASRATKNRKFKAMATTHSIDIVDVLCDLLADEQANIFHFMRNADPYIKAGGLDLRRPLRRMIDADLRREGELIGVITEQGGCPRLVPVCPEQQYMAYLSMGYLLPKLVEAREQTIRRYEQALADADGEVKVLLERHLAELRQEVESLRKAAKA